MALFIRRAYSTIVSSVLGKQLPVVSNLAQRFFSTSDDQCQLWAKKENAAGKCTNISIIAPVPRKRYVEVVDHVLCFLKEQENLSKSFPDDSGNREAEYSKFVELSLKQRLSAAALIGADKSGGGCVIAAAINRRVECNSLMNAEVECLGGKGKDKLITEVARMITMVHQQLNLFKCLNVQEFLDISIVSVDAQHRAKNLCPPLVKASMQLGATRGLKAVKMDATNNFMQECAKKACLGEVYCLPYKCYKRNDKVVFDCTEPPDDTYKVFAGRLTCAEPFVVPVELKKKKKDDCKPKKKKDDCKPKKKKKADCKPKKKKKDACKPKKKKKKDACKPKKKKKDACKPKKKKKDDCKPKKKKKDDCKPKKKKDPCKPKKPKKKKDDCKPKDKKKKKKPKKKC